MKRYLSLIFSLLTFAVTAQNTQPFSKLNIDAAGKVFIRQDSVYSVNDDEGRPLTGYSVTDGRLLLNKMEDVYVTLPKLEQISLNSSSKVIGQSTFNSESLALAINGTGSIDLDIDATNITASMPGMGKITLTGTARTAD